MRNLTFLLLIILAVIVYSSCKKRNNPFCKNCITGELILGNDGECGKFIKDNDTIEIFFLKNTNLPNKYTTKNTKVCVNYELYEEINSIDECGFYKLNCVKYEN